MTDKRTYIKREIASFSVVSRHMRVGPLLSPILDYISSHSCELAKYGIPVVEVSIDGGCPDSDDSEYAGWKEVNYSLIDKIKPWGFTTHVNVYMRQSVKKEKLK